jgi:hypothetical protein
MMLYVRLYSVADNNPSRCPTDILNFKNSMKTDTDFNVHWQFHRKQQE